MKTITFALWIVFSLIALLLDFLGKDGAYFLGTLGQMHFCVWLLMKYIDEKTTITISTDRFFRSKPKL